MNEKPTPRCRECGSPMSIVRVSDLCGWCQKGLPK